MIVLDHSASQQRRGTLINRYAYDEEEKIESSVAWEDYVRLPVVPRRSPWRTVGEDIESSSPTVSQEKVALTPSNITTITSPIATQQSSAIDQSVLISAVTQPSVISAIVAALPIIEFSCPE